MTGRHARFIVLAVLATVVLSTASCASQDPLPQEPSSQESLSYQSWTDLVDEGWAPAQYRLAREYDFGDDGVPEDDVEAVRWYRLAAEQGYADAQLTLSGTCIPVGVVVVGLAGRGGLIQRIRFPKFLARFTMSRSDVVERVDGRAD